MPHPGRPAPALARLLSNDPNGSALLAKAERLQALQGIVVRQLPPEFAASCRVVNIRGDVVVVHVATNAIAAKCRLLVPRLLRGFIEVVADVREVRFEVQTRAAAMDGDSPLARNRVAPPSAPLDALAGTLPPSPLRDAIVALAAKGRPRRD